MNDSDKAVLTMVTEWRDGRCVDDCKLCEWNDYCDLMFALAKELEKRLVGDKSDMV